jgi:hypothetical protein
LERKYEKYEIATPIALSLPAKVAVAYSQEKLRVGYSSKKNIIKV